MKKYLLFIILLFSNTIAQSQWQTIYSDTVNYDLMNVFFLNNDTGFVVGSDFSFPNQDGVILKTTDGGVTWDSTRVYPYLSCIQFLNDTLGFAGGQDGNVYVTTNTGNSWNWAGSGTWNDINSMYFLNQDTGFEADGTIHKTIDGGATWQPVFNSAGGAAINSGKMLFVDSLTAFVAQSFNVGGGNYRAISKTSDGGNTWIDLPIPFNFFPHSLFFFDVNNGWAVGDNGKISNTNDGGLTWSALDSIGELPLLDIHFINPSIGYITGGLNVLHCPTCHQGIIYKTSDGGNNWQIMDSTFTDGLVKMYFPSSSVGYATGMGGIILKITNADSVVSAVDYLHISGSDISAFPNPVSTSTTINIKNKNIQDAVLVVRNYTGQLVLQKTITATKPGFLSTAVDMQSFPEGIYLIEVLCNGTRLNEALKILKVE